MKKLLYFLTGAIIAIAVGIRDLVPAIRLLCNAAISGVDWAVAHLEKPAEEYLKGLKRLGTFTFLPPLLIVIIAFPFGWKTLMGWAGVWCFVWTLVLGTYGAPLGVLVDALATAGRTGAWATREAGLLARRLKSYISFVRQVLVYEAAAFLTLSIVPMQNYWQGVPVFLLIVGLLIITSYEWATETGKWLKPLVRFASFAGAAFLVLCFFFPGINFFNLLVYQGTAPEGKPKTREAVTEEHVGGLMKGAEAWVGSHWQQSGFWIGLAVAALLAYLAVRLFKKAIAPAGAGDRSMAVVSARESGGQRSNWLGKAFGVIGLLLGLGLLLLIALRVMEWDARRGARIDASIREARLYEEARTAIRTTSSLVAQVRTAQAQAEAPPSAPTELWYGLVSPKKYSITLSTNLSDKIPRPAGFSTRTEPRGLRYELWANGKLVPQVERGPTDFPPGTTFVQYRWTNRTSTTMVVGVGKEVK